MILFKCCTQYASSIWKYLGNSAMTTILEKVNFHFNPKKGNAKECSNYHTIAFSSHASKVNMLKILQARLQSMQAKNFQIYKLYLERAKEPEIKMPTPVGSQKKQGNSRKNIYFCFTDYVKAFDCVHYNKLWKILKEMGIPDHLTCLLRNLCAGQEATVRTTHGTTNWFKIGKGVHQGYILSTYLFNLCA